MEFFFGRYARTFIFFYSIVLHVLVFTSLYRFSSLTQRCVSNLHLALPCGDLSRHVAFGNEGRYSHFALAIVTGIPLTAKFFSECDDVERVTFLTVISQAERWSTRCWQLKISKTSLQLMGPQGQHFRFSLPIFFSPARGS